jgi:hypothetical protein
MNDPFFLPAGAAAFKSDIPDAAERFSTPAISRWKPMPRRLLRPSASSFPADVASQHHPFKFKETSNV